jgi:hypothetical protein
MLDTTHRRAGHPALNTGSTAAVVAIRPTGAGPRASTSRRGASPRCFRGTMRGRSRCCSAPALLFLQRHACRAAACRSISGARCG